MTSRPSTGSPPPALLRSRVLDGRTVELRVGGTSMLPLVLPGATLWIGPFPGDGPRKWDLAAVELHGRTVCHLVSSVRTDELGPLFTTRGLSNLHPDPPSRPVHLVGLVTRIVQGPFDLSTNSPAFRILVAGSAVAGFLLGATRAALARLGRHG